MTRVLVVSDDHGVTAKLVDIINKHKNDVDYKIHCGDFCIDDAAITKLFDCVVSGNNDFSSSLPSEKIITIEKMRILVCHSHTITNNRLFFHKPLVQYAISHHCQAVLHGHSHILSHRKINGIDIICPGSISFPRSLSGRTYMILKVSEKQIIDIQVYKI